jgi:hypothetical protein
MSRFNKILLIALVAQVGLVIATWSMRGSAPSVDAQPLIPDVSVDDVTALRIEAAPANDKPGKVLSIKKSGDGWVLPEAGDYPADAKKVKTVLDALLSGRVRAPLASKKSNHNALEVGERTYSRKVKLTAGDTTHDLVVGTARGTAAHVRRANEDMVYLARGFSATTLDEAASAYIDTTYLDVEDPDQIVVKNPRGSMTLNKREGVWTIEELDPNTVTDPERFEAFVSQARKLIIDHPVGKEVKDEYGLTTPLAAHITLKKGETTYTYSLGSVLDGNRYVKRADNDWVVMIPTFAVSSLMEQIPQNFIKEDRPQPSPGGMPGLPGGLPQMPGLPGMPR